MEANKIRLNPEKIRLQLNIAMNKNVLPAKEENKPEDFIEFMSQFIKSRRLTKRNIQRLTQTRKLVILAFGCTTKKRLAQWEALSAKQKSKSELIADYKLKFEDVNLQLLEKYKEYLLNTPYQVKFRGVEVTQNYKVNYVEKQLKGLKQFIRAAIDKKLVGHFTWNTLQVENYEVDSIYTSFDEIQAIYDLQLEDPLEILVRDKYVLNCHFGMRYSDLNKISKHLFPRIKIKGVEYVTYHGRSQKTDIRTQFPIHQSAIAVLEKYQYQIPKLSAGIFNNIIKVVAEKAGLINEVRIKEKRGHETIEKDIPKYQLMATHTGRRSFCTNYTIEGVPSSVIMSISGHKTEKEFLKYVKQPVARIEVVAEYIAKIPGFLKKENELETSLITN